MTVAGYNTIAAASEGVFKDRGSSFLGFAFPVEDEEEVKKFLQQVKKQHHKCNHHCYAFRLKPDGSHFRSSDDREPSGSAGKPILGQLLSYQLTFTLIVVARYFGGSLLGVPGLIHAYRAAAEDAIAHAQIIYRTVNITASLSFPYPMLNEVMLMLKNTSFKTIQQDYSETVNLVIDLPVESYEKFHDQIKASESGYLITLAIIQQNE
jgi:uncharacterized YigZ family protein